MHLNSKNDFSKFAFIFDHDGVIADNESLHERAWQKLFANHDLKISNSDYLLKAKGFATKDTVINLFPKLSENEKQELVTEKMEIYEEMMKKSLKPVAGVVDFIKKSKSMGIKIAIGSGGHRKRIDYSVNKFGITKYIDIIMSVEDVIKNKPNPEVYLKAIEKLKFDPKGCFIFEDSPTGLLAANLSGANIIFVNTSNLDTKQIQQKYIMEILNFLNVDVANIIKSII